jgi:hypothetical protein
MQRPSLRQGVGAAAALCGMGALLLYHAVREDPRLNVPPLVAMALAVGLFLAAAAVVARATHRDRVIPGLVALVLVSFAITGAWIGFGPGERSCSGTIGGASSRRGGTECRVVFGSGSLVTAAMALWAARQWWRERGG